ncbi:tRNA-guanine transglycosylase [Dacryopinax primogenitus]|uniref:tRNA-guanine transglycosylase n=1 Tax=Dacryopinax primogenitus (strain DJM 731) TaxID=1858805 RepID=M5FV10_DACPD|nr:tRNA-guanine transglycosylase [Dacryopinax primogenitus]EJU01606.1 tRNA-guanine transglycosylase [Dacryopinax primogenitus]
MSGATARPPPVLSFKLLSVPATPFSPRLGLARLIRSSTEVIDVVTPGLFLHTSRGHVPHLSVDHISLMAKQMPWLHASFEGFLETLPPTPTLQPGPQPLHTFFGLPAASHIISLSLRDPADVQERPPDGDDYLSSMTIRGVRKIEPSFYRSYVSCVQPDIIIALSDIPFTLPPFSQKRMTKSIDRTIRWLGEILKSRPSMEITDNIRGNNIFVSLVGGTNAAARRAFSQNLLGPLEEGSNLSSVRPQTIPRLDDHISGYVLEMAQLRLELSASLSCGNDSSSTKEPTQAINQLLKASLSPLPADKLRVVHSSISPHEMLRLISLCGIDLFDSYWAQKAADWGIALDFSFPVSTSRDDTGPTRRSDGKRDVGHNLYHTGYAFDFRGLVGGPMHGCSCLACAPSFTKPIPHSSLEFVNDGCEEDAPAFTRAYIHHLLHTHEMSAHALLVSHNITVLQDFFAAIRSTLSADAPQFDTEVARFETEYDGDMRIIEEGRRAWEEVDCARGKGRLARERGTI